MDASPDSSAILGFCTRLLLLPTNNTLTFELLFLEVTESVASGVQGAVKVSTICGGLDIRVMLYFLASN